INRGDVWRCRPSGFCHHGIDFEIAIAHMDEGARRLAESEVDVPGQHILVEGGATAIGYEREARTSAPLEVDTGDLRATDANCPGCCLPRVLLQASDQFLEILRRQCLSCNDPLRSICEQRHRFEVFDYIVLESITRAV